MAWDRKGTDNMHNFRYVTKKEFLPIKKELIEIINKVQDIVRNEFTFRYDFIGSASRNAITMDECSNTGFDFDVNIRVNDDDENYNAQEIKSILINAFNRVVGNYGYDYGEDSKRVITIKVKDRDNSRILHSCDFAIVYDCSDGRQQFIYFNKAQQTYEWHYQPKGFYQLEVKMQKIKNNGLWNELRDLYLYKKNTNNDQKKKSRSIWAESVNEIVNSYNL